MTNRNASAAPHKIMIVVGTRPEAIKMAPVVYQLRQQPERFDTLLVSTGQQRELLAQALGAFDLTPDLDLDLMETGQSLTGYAGRALRELGFAIAQHKPGMVLVQGDTTTVAMASIAAFYNGVMVGHVEAGLRTYDRSHPFPEEMNRELADLIADVHFAPTEGARINLMTRGFTGDRVIVTGNTIVDAQRMIPLERGFDDPALARFESRDERLIVVTTHRRETHGKPLRNICRAIREIASLHPDVRIVLPVHPNPDVRGTVHDKLDGLERIHVIPAVAYGDMLRLMRHAYMLISDSGGIQEEAVSLNVPLLILRKVTERSEVVEVGAARLVGTSTPGIVAAATRLLSSDVEYQQLRGAANPYGDGHAAERIVHALWQRMETRASSRWAA